MKMKMDIKLNLDLRELNQVIEEEVNKAVFEECAPVYFLKGTGELAEFLGISKSKAQELKNEGVFSCFQIDRIVLFDPDIVTKELEDYNQKEKNIKKYPRIKTVDN